MASETDKMILKLNRATEKEIRKLVLDVHADLAIFTPVEFGWAANNWIVTIGTFSDAPLGTRDNYSSSQMDAGLSSIIGWHIPKGVIYITNNVPYISPLNAGSSTQAPAGFVDKIVQRRVDEHNAKGSIE